LLLASIAANTVEKRGTSSVSLLWMFSTAAKRIHRVVFIALVLD
jgi:hypothetical protein